MSLLLALALQAAAEGRRSLGTFEAWGAFRDAAPQRCFAIAEPLGRTRPTRPFASVATWPGTAARNQFHARLSRPRASAAKVTLSIGERRFELLAGPVDAWSPDPATDRAIVTAMRGGRSMSVESVSAAGQPFADTYALKGAATAIDAAAVGCARV
ncbi:invasion associated locus B family protein [Sphingomonas sp.]|uniref:invasion associated locus B family protein n=1 Tax=Sphingomonas sp. TaxID=28214 RepID=UPI002DD6B56B|nr:invasion associated locus B family protein [Sphingomonas sp.]